MNATIHAIRNQLAVAVASVEAFIDEKLQPTPHRLRSVCEALAEIDALLSEIATTPLQTLPDEAQIVEISTIIGNEVVAIAAATAADRIKLAIHHFPTSLRITERDEVGDCDRVGQVVRDLLLNAIHHTPPGGTIVVDCHRAGDRFEFSVSNEAPEIDPGRVRARGGTISIVSRPGDGATFTVRLLDGLAGSARPSTLPGDPIVMVAPLRELA